MAAHHCTYTCTYTCTMTIRMCTYTGRNNNNTIANAPQEIPRLSLSWRRRARRRGRPRSWPRTNAMAALLLPLKNWSQVLGLHTRRMGARVWEEISRWVRRGRSSTRSSPRVHLLRAMRLAREGCKSVHQPGLLSCFRNAEERRRCEVMEAALRPQKRGPRQRTSVSACRVR